MMTQGHALRDKVSLASDGVPEGWCQTTLGTVANLISGAGFPLKYQGQSGQAFPFFKVGNLRQVAAGTALTNSEDTIDKETAHELRAAIIPPESVVFAKIGMAIRLNRRRPVGVPCCIDNNMMAAVPTPAITPRYLLRFLETVELMELAQATTVPSIRKSELIKIGIPLAPVAEQERLIEKVETLFSCVNSALERLVRVPAILNRFRQAVLTAAFSGRLTEDWRNDQPNLGEWRSILATDACEVVQSGSTPSAHLFRLDRGVPFLKVYNIVNQRIDFESKPQFIDETIHKGHLKKSIVKPGDVLMNIVGPPLGKVAMVPSSYPEWNINQAITMFRPKDGILTSKFLYLLLCSGQPYLDTLQQTRGSAGQSNISLSQCRQMKFGVPSIIEQHEIVRAVERLFAIADSIEKAVAAALKKAEKLAQAVLAKAFRGELVPTEAELARREGREYEPASMLLERIKKERESKTTSKPERKRTRHRR
jgi:type I restriction enzyme S subunit